MKHWLSFFWLLLAASACANVPKHFDYRGSTVALTDSNGSVTDRIEYSAYATTTYRTGTSDTPFLFNGRYGVQTDPNGLLHMRARYYNPLLCRFLTSDPSGFSGGLNHYAFADGNPVSLLDPFGLGAIGEGAGSSWLNTAWNVTKGAGMTAAGFVPWLGDAMEAYTVVAPGSSGLDRTLSSVSLAANAWTAGLLPNLGPIKRGLGMMSDAFSGAKGPVRAFEVGTASDLLAGSIRGDRLDIHHVGQAHPLEQMIPGYNRATAPAIAVPRAQHSTIPTVRGTYSGNARDQIAKDIRDLRNYTDAPNSSLRELIDLNKQTYPNAFQK